MKLIVTSAGQEQMWNQDQLHVTPKEPQVLRFLAVVCDICSLLKIQPFPGTLNGDPGTEPAPVLIKSGNNNRLQW